MMDQKHIDYLKANAANKTIDELIEATGLSKFTIYGFCSLAKINRRAFRGGRKLSMPAPRRKTITRPPAVYTNIPSPYGIWDELRQAM